MLLSYLQSYYVLNILYIEREIYSCYPTNLQHWVSSSHTDVSCGLIAFFCICNNVAEELIQGHWTGAVWPWGQVTLNSLITKALSCLRHQRQLPNWCVWRLILKSKRYVCVMVEEPHGITINTMHVHPLLESLLSFSLFLLPADSVLHLTPFLYSPLLVYQQKDPLKQVSSFRQFNTSCVFLG